VSGLVLCARKSSRYNKQLGYVNKTLLCISFTDSLMELSKIAAFWWF